MVLAQSVVDYAKKQEVLGSSPSCRQRFKGVMVAGGVLAPHLACEQGIEPSGAQIGPYSELVTRLPSPKRCWDKLQHHHRDPAGEKVVKK